MKMQTHTCDQRADHLFRWNSVLRALLLCGVMGGGFAGTACGELLIGLGEIQAKLTAAHAEFLRRFDAAGAHDSDGYGSPSAWLAAKGGMSKGAARASVRRMRQLGDRPLRPPAGCGRSGCACRRGACGSSPRS